MAIKIKAKPPAVKAVLKVLDEVGENVDRWAELDVQIKKMKAKMEPLVLEQTTIRKELDATEAVVKAAAAEKVRLTGIQGGILEYGPKANQVIAVDKAKVRELLGEETYFALAEIGVGPLREYLTPPQLEMCMTEEQIGARRVKYFEPTK